MAKYCFLFLMLLAGCARLPTPPLVQSVPLSAPSGAQVLADLQRLYSSAPANCGSDSLHGFLCSGIIMRDADFSTSFRAWDPSPKQVNKGGVSFFYIRKDSKFLMYSGFTKGYIIYPELERPADKAQLMVECFFPVDGGTDVRKDSGCGPTPSYADSDRCHLLQPAVTTPDQWINHFYKGDVANRNQHQCAFGISGRDNERAALTFNVALGAMALLNQNYQNKSFNEWNEILLKVWGQGIGRSLPIKAFWYRTNGSTNGSADAQRIQRDFLCNASGGGVLLPLIRVLPPRTINEDFLFQYNPEDQSASSCT